MDGRLLHPIAENRDVKYWSESNQYASGDSLPAGYVSRYIETQHVSVRQNDLEELKQIWEDLNRTDRQAFIDRYGDIAYLLYVQVNEPMLRALIKFWNPGYCCFTLNRIDLMPTVEEYSELLRVPNIIEDRIYTKPKKNTNMPAQLAAFTGRSEEWASKLISKKGESHCFSWLDIANITRTYPDPLKKAHLIAIAIYGLVIFPRVLGYIDVALFDVFDQFRYGINPTPAILAETFISLNACRELEGGRFRGCAQLLYVWIRSHFWKTPKPVLPGIRSMNFSPLREFLAKEWEEVDLTKWVEVFRNLQEQDLVWRTPWLLTIEYLYRCYDHHWLMLLGLWGAIGCAPLLVSRQFGSRQFMPFTAGLRGSWFAFDEKFKDSVSAINKNWKHCYRVKVACDQTSMVTPDYVHWIQTRINDTIPFPNQGQNVPMVDHLRVVPSKADMLRTELAKAEDMIEKMGLQQTRDLFLVKVQVEKFAGEAEHATKEYLKLKTEYDIQNNDFKKLEASVKHMELHKTPTEWRQEIQQAEDRQKNRAEREIQKQKEKNPDLMRFEKKGKQIIERYQKALETEKNNAASWKRKSYDNKIRLTESQNAYNELEVQLNQSRAQHIQLEARVREQEDIIREYQTRDEYTELQASQSKVEALEKEVKDLWALVQTCQISIQVLEDAKKGGNDYWFTRLRDAAHRFQEQDKTNEKIMNLAQDVAEHVTTIARKARILRPHAISREMKSELELLFDQIKDLGVRVKPYLPRE
ncbi:hypothetical protein V6N11_044428 [Hibiscus sabdariffa]|uniref:DUF7745 domain-containing protein n=1 Tax=Hibiscus sabdariffa TaxID=183260 RepID=A0ABR2RF53_9ROSI